MFTHLDHLIVAVDDLEAAAKNYQTLFGMTQVWSVASIEETHKRLLGEGIDITPIKKGIKDKTLVQL